MIRSTVPSPKGRIIIVRRMAKGSTRDPLTPTVEVESDRYPASRTARTTLPLSLPPGSDMCSGS